MQGQRSVHKSSAQITAQMLNKHPHGRSIEHKWTLVFIISSPSHSGYPPPGCSECSLRLLTLFAIFSDEQAKCFSSSLNPKKERDANVSNVSPSLSSRVTTADVTFSRVGTDPLVTCALLHMSFRIISGQGTAAVWESWSGGKKETFGN